jgi:alpha-amylase/alpha-mannosidase (GH57 family)
VSDQTLAIAAEEGFRWFGTDEGVLGRTLNLGFFREASGLPANADKLYQPWRVQMGSSGITGLFRDHLISDLIGFVYSRMDSKAGAADLHGRLRAIGERVPDRSPPDRVPVFGRGKRLGILPGTRPRIPARVFTAVSRMTATSAP